MKNKDCIDLINQLVNEFDNYYDKNEIQKPTFLSVIRKSNNENYISRILLYTINKDKKLLSKLITKYINRYYHNIVLGTQFEIQNIVCEKYMSGRRADIFAQIIDELGKEYTLTIENKVDTWEHTEQTNFYKEWVEKAFPNAINIFYYLKPDYNGSVSTCNEFFDIRYSELKNLISVENNYIIDDFKIHIEQELGEKSMSFKEYEILAIENYKTLTNIIKSVDEIVSSTKQNIAKNLKDRFLKKYNDIEFQENITDSFRIYKKNWFLENEYYFYAEIFYSDNLLDRICFQQTLKFYRDSKAKNNLNDFCQECDINIVDIINMYNIFKREHLREINSKINYYDDDFIEKFCEVAFSVLDRYINEIDNIFNKWSIWYNDKYN